MKYKLHLSITSKCNLNCPDCCILHGKSGFDYDYKKLKQLSKLINDLDILIITGGEPTIHSEFREIILMVKDSFNYEKIILCTNGAKLLNYKDLLPVFNDIRVSAYDTGSVNNMYVINEIKKYINDNSVKNIRIFQKTHFIKNNDFKNPCGRDKMNSVVYHDGMLYSCCVACGIDKSIGVIPDENLERQLFEIKLPCSKCLFAKQ